MVRRRADGQAGFIITLEFLLIMTILGIGVLVGLAAVRNALFKRAVNQRSQQVWVYDSSVPPIVLGPARDFDEHEAPRLFYIDYDVEDWGGNNYRAFVGVRDDRFTGRQRIFYTNSFDCGATPIDANVDVQACILRPSDEDGDNRGVGVIGVTVTDALGGTLSGTGQLSLAGGVGYLYPLQSAALTGPTYGIGRDLDDASGLPGTLYRQSPDPCNSTLVRSVWTSQLVFSGLPCEALPAGVTIEAAKCPVGQDTDVGLPCTSPADPRCISGGHCSNIPGRACTIDDSCETSLIACADSGQACTLLGDECMGVCSDDFNTQCVANGDCGGGAQCLGYQGACTDYTLAAPQQCDLTPQQCLCPGINDANPNNDWVDFGANCCPAGSLESAPGQCTIGDDGSVREATPVQRGGENVFANLQRPFHVFLPPDQNSWEFIEPTDEGDAPGAPTGIDFDTQDFQFNRAPDGEGP